MTTARSTLVLGGVRSGKSRLAERLADESELEVVYIATAQPRDDAEMAERIASHRSRRPPEWKTIEAPIHLADTLRASCTRERCVLVDCLTLWLTNLLCSNNDVLMAAEREALIESLPHLPGQVILVSNETGLGVVPMGALSRRFVDEAGALHQRLAEHCGRVVLTVAGLPLVMKGAALAAGAGH